MNYEELQERVSLLKETGQDLNDIQTISTKGNKKGTKSVSSKISRPGTSKSKGNTKNKGVIETFQNISVEVFIELIKSR